MTLELPKSAHRVSQHTAEFINRRIRQQTAESISYYAGATPEDISRRIEELDQEWDIERALEANAAVFSLIGIGLGTSVDRRWLLLSATVGGFLLMHALQGWCPPVPLFRRMGFRTRHEIDREKYALKVLRGDFRELPPEPGQEREKLLAALDR